MSLFNSQLYHPQTYFIDSQERVSGRPGAFLSAPINMTNSNSYDTVIMSQCAIPKSWYNVPQNYNTFTLDENGAQVIISIPIGNYNKNNLMVVLSNLLTTNSPNGKTYSITYPNINTEGDTGKYTFTVSPWGVGDTYSFIFDSQSMFQQMGFDGSSTNTFDPATGTLTSTNQINFQIISSIFITSDLCVEEDVFQEIYNVGTVISSAFIYFQQNTYDMNTKRLLTNSNNSWNFVLLDQLDREIYLNGVDWQFSMIFYHRMDYPELARQNLQIKNLERIVQNEKILKDMEI